MAQFTATAGSVSPSTGTDPNRITFWSGYFQSFKRSILKMEPVVRIEYDHKKGGLHIQFENPQNKENARQFGNGGVVDEMFERCTESFGKNLPGEHNPGE